MVLHDKFDAALINGFLKKPRRNARESLYRGRLVLPDVQWTGRGEDSFATCTMTVGELADAMESRLLWTDQSVQRGISPSAPGGVPRELTLADGYPDTTRYIFDAANADNMADKLL